MTARPPGGDPGPRGRPHLPRRGLRRRGRDVRRGGVLHRHDRLPGDADRPVVPPPGRGDDRAAHRQHRHERRGPGVVADLGRRLRRARPRPGPVELALARGPRRRAARPGRRRDHRHRHPRADPAPARARRDAGRHLHRPRPTPTTLLRAGAAPPREMAGAELAGEVSTTEAYVVPGAVGRRSAFTVAALDLGIKAKTPRLMAERGIEVHVLPATATLDDVLAVEPDGLFFSNGPGDPAATTGQVELLQGALDAGPAVLRDLLRQPAVRPGARLRHLQAEVRPPRHQPAGDGPHHRQGRGHRAQPRVRGRRAARRADRRRRTASPTVSHVCLNDDVVEGLELRDADGTLTGFSVQYHPEAAAGPHDAAYLFDRFCDLMVSKLDHRGGLMPKRTDIKSVLVIGSGPIVIGQACEFDYSGTQACRVLARRGHPGHPGQLQPGHDHDRPGVRRRDLRRADHRRSSSRR